MKTKTQILLAWIAMIILFGAMSIMLYADYREDVRQGRIMRVMYP